MARIARVIAVGYPHYITQRGNRRQMTFFCDEDYIAYIELMAQREGQREGSSPLLALIAPYANAQIDNVLQIPSFPF